jgi:thioredoxin reductase
MLETLILGAGPAGCQMAYFLQKAGLPYLVLERGREAATFFASYPQSGRLISINKRHTGRENADFALRHDWNSLLSDDPSMRFTEFSDDYYPDKEDLHIYLNRFAKHFQLKIRYECTVFRIEKTHTDETTYLVHFKHKEKRYRLPCRKLIVASGLGLPVKPDIPLNVKKPIYHYAEFPKGFFLEKENLERYANKSLLILGNGNSAYELANLLTPYCSSIIIHGRKPKQWACSSHYTGDLRSIYLPYLDTFLLKSLNAWNHCPHRKLMIDQETIESKYILSYLCEEGCDTKHKFYEDSLNGFDEVIFSTGWKFDSSLYDFDFYVTEDEKYPMISPYFEALHNPNLYFIGALGHSLDYKKSSGGFIHGFRYLIQFFYRFHYEKRFPRQEFQREDPKSLILYLLERINTASSLYQMYGYLCDFFYVSGDTIVYVTDIIKEYADSPDHIITGKYSFLLTLEYGEERITDIYKFGQKVSDLGTESKSTLLHPVLRIFEQGDRKRLIDIVHFDEDLLANYTFQEKYADKFERTLRGYL